MIRFQADADLNGHILRAIRRREPGIDFKSADAAQLRGVPDPEVLARAADENRILVTHDMRTMPKHFATYLQTHTSPGVFIVPQSLPIATAADELILIWAASEAEEWTDRIFWLTG